MGNAIFFCMFGVTSKMKHCFGDRKSFLRPMTLTQVIDFKVEWNSRHLVCYKCSVLRSAANLPLRGISSHLATRPSLPLYLCWGYWLQFVAVYDGIICNKRNFLSFRRIPLYCRSALRGKIFNPLNAELNPICYFLTLFGARHILHVSRIRVQKALIIRNSSTVKSASPTLDVYWAS